MAGGSVKKDRGVNAELVECESRARDAGLEEAPFGVVRRGSRAGSCIEMISSLAKARVPAGCVLITMGRKNPPCRRDLP